MTPCALPQALPISCKDCPAFQRLHMSFRCCSESLNRLLNVINTTFKEMTYTRSCCIDRLSRQPKPAKQEAKMSRFKDWNIGTKLTALILVVGVGFAIFGWV